jgi:hypothetical protein
MGDQAADEGFDFTVSEQAGLYQTAEPTTIVLENSVPDKNEAAVGGEGDGEGLVPSEGADHLATTPHDLMTPPLGRVVSVPSGSRYSLETPSSENLDADHEEDAPLRYRRLTDILGPSSPPSRAARDATEYLLLASEEEPTTFKQAEQSAPWKRAMLEEINSIEENDT